MPTGRLGGTLFSIDIVKYPDPSLRSISKVVAFPLDDKTQRLIKWMVRAMYQNHGIGLAAVQVGYEKRIFIMDCTRAQQTAQVFINPTIIKTSVESLTDFEGCLSAPGKRGEVKRYLRIVLNYKDEKGEEHTKTFYNLEARCIQHELDHLDGKLCIDYGERGKNRGQEDNPEAMVESDFGVKSDS